MNEISKLFGIKYPIIQGGMVWCSGWRLVTAVSNAGGLGLLGAGSMRPELLKEHITKVKEATDKPFGVNVPLLYSYSDEFIDIIIDEKVPIVFTSAGSPKKYTARLQSHGIKVAHVVSSAFFAKKSADAGVDAVVAEGFEAGGHNGKEETTTLILVEMVKKAINIPVIAAGGIATGKSMLASMVLGADGVQIGSLFAASEESSASLPFKQFVVDAAEGDTVLALKKLAPVRMLKNEFVSQLLKMENEGVNADYIKEFLGKGRARNGIFEGDLVNGELEIGQSSALINNILPVEQIMVNLLTEYRNALLMLDKLHV